MPIATPASPSTTSSATPNKSPLVPCICLLYLVAELVFAPPHGAFVHPEMVRELVPNSLADHPAYGDIELGGLVLYRQLVERDRVGERRAHAVKIAARSVRHAFVESKQRLVWMQTFALPIFL